MKYRLNQLFEMYGKVFYISFFIIILITLITVVMPNVISVLFADIQNWIVTNIGWSYVLGMAIFLIISVYMIVSKYGSIKLGPDDSVPEYSFFTWFAMLFSAGMGVGIMFFGVAEPLEHYINPPISVLGSVSTAKLAMDITFFHWGLQAWAVYGLMGLTLAYFTYRHHLPLLPRSAFYPIIGNKIYGPIGHTIDIFAILGTIFGLTTSMGLGATQINAGLGYVFHLPSSVFIQSVIIVIITLLSSISVALGLDKGIKILSFINIILAVLLLLYVMIAFSFHNLLTYFVQNIGMYLSTIVQKTFNLYAYKNKTGWMENWTLFYWAWWITWSPFVGMFIAKISKGRTIREFLLGVLVAPVLFTFLWLTVFGNSAIQMVLHSPNSLLLQTIKEKPLSFALFAFLQNFPFSLLTSVVALILIIVFFVTSLDSGALILDQLTSVGHKKSYAWQRILWTVLTGLLAIVLLYASGLKGLQTATISAAFFVLIILFIMCFALIKSLREDYLRTVEINNLPMPINIQDTSWKERIEVLLTYPNKKDSTIFLQTTVKEAVQKVYGYLKKQGVSCKIEITPTFIKLHIPNKKNYDFIYYVKLIRLDSDKIIATSQKVKEFYRVEVFLDNGGQKYDIMGFTQQQIITDIVNQYERYTHYIYINEYV